MMKQMDSFPFYTVLIFYFIAYLTKIVYSINSFLNTFVMRTALVALAVFRTLFLWGVLEYKPVIGSVNGEAKAGRGLGKTKLKCCHRSSSWMRRGWVCKFWSGYVGLCVAVYSFGNAFCSFHAGRTARSQSEPAGL